MTTMAHKVRCVKEWIILTHVSNEEFARKIAIEAAQSMKPSDLPYKTVWDVVCSAEVDLNEPEES